MSHWLELSDIEKIEDFDKETGDRLIQYYMKISTDLISLPSGLEDEALEEHIQAIEDEILYIFEEYYEKFFCDKFQETFNYKIEADKELNLPSMELISIPKKKSGSLLVICNPDDLATIIGSGKYKQIAAKLLRKKADNLNLKLNVGD